MSHTSEVIFELVDKAIQDLGPDSVVQVELSMMTWIGFKQNKDLSQKIWQGAANALISIQVI